MNGRNAQVEALQLLLAPVVVGRLADPGLAADLAYCPAFLSLPQNESNLCVNFDVFMVLPGPTEYTVTHEIVLTTKL